MKPYHATPDQMARFSRERDVYCLRFRCPDCAHARIRTDATVFCSLGYPNETLMKADDFLEGGSGPSGGPTSGQFVFCKYFELF